MSTIVFSVELHIRDSSNVFQHFVAEAGGDEYLAAAKVEQALNRALYRLLEKEVFPVAKGGEGDG